MSRYYLTDNQWSSLHAFLRAHPRVYRLLQGGGDRFHGVECGGITAINY